jgi:hypothetical protein
MDGSGWNRADELKEEIKVLKNLLKASQVQEQTSRVEANRLREELNRLKILIRNV